MSIMEEIYHEYVRMRENGLEKKETLKALRAYIEALDNQDKNTLAQYLRQWEKDLSSSTHSSKKAATALKSLKKLKPAAPTAMLESWVECTNCGKKNRVADVFCYSCGHILETASTIHDTQHFANATDDLHKEDYYGQDSVLLLQVRNSQMVYELRPQNINHEIILGRGSGTNVMSPDVDLESVNGAVHGVSRLHASMQYHDNIITISDLGSANGTFVNGQKLHAQEDRILRNGDELRLGRLILKVYFQHPGEAI